VFHTTIWHQDDKRSIAVILLHNPNSHKKLGSMCVSLLPNKVRIDSHHVDPRHRRKGYGTLMMEELIKHADRLNKDSIITNAATKSGRALLEKFGFTWNENDMEWQLPI
jgi:GNAT superfamily N-acetyltransferase